jgi:endonuclease/exonuclease/phosphatase (EEP) superfamily protein YafD
VYRIRCAFWLIYGAALATMLVRWWPGDAVNLFQSVVYPPIAGFAGAGFFATFFASGAFRRRGAAAVVILVLGIAGFLREQPALLWRPSAGPAYGPPLRVMLYNVQSFRNKIPPVVAVIKEEKPDVIGLLEATTWGKIHGNLKKFTAPDYTWTTTRHLALGSQMKLLETERIQFGNGGNIFRSRLEWDGRELALWLVDMPAPPLRDAENLFAELSALLETEELPLIVIGDFNTPRQSRLLRRTFSGYHDLSLAPEGPRWLATWRNDFPMWQIDHGFASWHFSPVRAEIVGGEASDHFGVVFDVAWAIEKPE